MTHITYKVFPAIGIARVGNSDESFYIDPEEAGALPLLPDEDRPFTADDFRDRSGRLKRQAARFRIYQYDSDGNNLGEVIPGQNGVRAIRWTVHLANKKASWYEFQTQAGAEGYASNHPLRNAHVTDPAERQQLNIDAGPRSLEVDASLSPQSAQFSQDSVPAGYPSSFPPELTSHTGEDPAQSFRIETLGEIRTDDQGRLLVLGGYGLSGSDRKPKLPAYANNDHWWDDTSDGPVFASIIYEDNAIPTAEAESAWALVAPPAYAPEIENLVTLYDTILDVAVRKQNARPDIFAQGMWNTDYRPNYEQDIRPLIERGEGYPWVVAIPPKPHKFDYAMLGNPDPGFNGMRQYILDVMRAPNDENTLVSGRSGATMMPYLAGDDAIGATDKTKEKYLRLTDTQYFMLQQWAQGKFDPGPAPEPDPGEALTRNVLVNCVGGAFSPGIEMTWISRDPAIYNEAFRIRARKNLPAPLSLGFNPEEGMEPGDICRYMAIPWQADFNECSSQPIGDRVLWWWPSQRPAVVYVNLGDTGERKQVPWVGTMYDQNAGDYISFPDNVEMVNHWHQLGFIYNQGDEDNPDFVEVQRTLKRPHLNADE